MVGQHLAQIQMFQNNVGIAIINHPLNHHFYGLVGSPSKIRVVYGIAIPTGPFQRILEVPREVRLVSNQVNIHTVFPNAKLQRCSAICTSVEQQNSDMADPWVKIDEKKLKVRKIN